MYDKAEVNGECSEVIKTQQASVKSDGLADRQNCYTIKYDKADFKSQVVTESTCNL